MKRSKVAIAVVVTGAMAALGIGCTAEPPGTSQQEQQQAQWLGNGIFAIIYAAMCQANYGTCPFPLGPSDPPP